MVDHKSALLAFKNELDNNRQQKTEDLSGLPSVVVIDDSAVARSWIKSLLDRFSCRALIYNDGDSALRDLRANQKSIKPALVLTDLQMPGLNGVELTKELKKIPAYANLPIIISSAENKADWVLKGKEAGVGGWIIKPIKAEA